MRNVGDFESHMYFINMKLPSHHVKSKSHPVMRFSPVQVFSCKHPLSVNRETIAIKRTNDVRVTILQFLSEFCHFSHFNGKDRQT